MSLIQQGGEGVPSLYNNTVAIPGGILAFERMGAESRVASFINVEPSSVTNLKNNYFICLIPST